MKIRSESSVPPIFVKSHKRGTNLCRSGAKQEVHSSSTQPTMFSFSCPRSKRQIEIGFLAWNQSYKTICKTQKFGTLNALDLKFSSLYSSRILNFSLSNPRYFNLKDLKKGNNFSRQTGSFLFNYWSEYFLFHLHSNG